MHCRQSVVFSAKGGGKCLVNTYKEMHHFAQVTFRDQGYFQEFAKEKWGLVLGREDLQKSNPPHSFKNSYCAVINARGGYFEVNANFKPE